MIRFLFRLLATVALAVAVVMAVLDATRSIATSTVSLTALAESWQAASPQTLEGLRQTVVETAGEPAWRAIEASVLSLPGFVAFAVLALLLYAIGHRPQRRARPALR
ncbi:MAG: hypothetical protein K5872_05625 [Rhizobiaceae bacterium]|nr:hypothetical protein [Rhizobiaceae bacterium]MCV0405691.1 hypothetical protein [Rhizobiaceae bacterium]